MIKDMFRFTEHPEFANPSLIVGWHEDVGKLSPKVMDYLNRKLDSESFCEVEPEGFFSLGGVAIENDVARFPVNRFYYSKEHNLIIFRGTEPHFEKYKFLNAILDVAEHYCKVKEFLTINGMISSIAYTDPRRMLTVFNQEAFQKELRGYGLEDMNWKGPPATSTYLLWIGRRRGIAGCSLWTEVPFYLGTSEDFQAVKRVLSFLNRRFSLGVNLRELDERIREQDEKINQLREEDSEINRYMGTLESGLSLSEEEQIELIRRITGLLEKNS